MHMYIAHLFFVKSCFFSVSRQSTQCWSSSTYTCTCSSIVPEMLVGAYKYHATWWQYYKQAISCIYTLYYMQCTLRTYTCCSWRVKLSTEPSSIAIAAIFLSRSTRTIIMRRNNYEHSTIQHVRRIFSFKSTPAVRDITCTVYTSPSCSCCRPALNSKMVVWLREHFVSKTSLSSSSRTLVCSEVKVTLPYKWQLLKLWALLVNVGSNYYVSPSQ